MLEAMPPRSSLTSSFSVSDANNEVVCPLQNHDGSQCRKRCLGEKRYRSMQEHIRRAHPEYYLPKLPATEESFQLMINTPPSERPPGPPAPAPGRKGHIHDRDKYLKEGSSPGTPRAIDESNPSAANAAVALAQLHHHRLSSDWDSMSEADYLSENEYKGQRMRSSIELPPLRDHLKQDSLPSFQSSRPRELLPSILGHSPPGRSSTLPPIQRRDKISRPRKSSVNKNVAKPKHDRNRSKELARRLSIDGGRKAYSAEPPAAAWVQGKRWEDLIEAATSATEVDDDRDLTPVPHSPSLPPIGPSSRSLHRTSLTPGVPTSLHHHHHFQGNSYHASPLQNALTPPPPDPHPENEPEPYPSVESGQNFHIPSSGLTSTNSDSSPLQSFAHPGQNVQIFCARCSRPWLLKDCFACTECICGICPECTTALTFGGSGGVVGEGRFCPRCKVFGGRLKAFQLDFR